MKRKDKLYFKVVDRDDDTGDIFSCSVNGKAVVRYYTNKYVSAPKWLRDKNYNLLVFTSKEDAEVFIHTEGMGFTRIYSCRIIGIQTKLPFRCDIGELSSGKIVKAYLPEFPPGTVMAKKVKLIQEVDYVV
jgi:hypothetical protein